MNLGLAEFEKTSVKFSCFERVMKCEFAWLDFCINIDSVNLIRLEMKIEQVMSTESKPSFNTVNLVLKEPRETKWFDSTDKQGGGMALRESTKSKLRKPP